MFDLMSEQLLKYYDVSNLVNSNITTRVKDNLRKIKVAKFMETEFFGLVGKIFKMMDNKNTLPQSIFKKILQPKTFKFGSEDLLDVSNLVISQLPVEDKVKEAIYDKVL
jgi:hypothetical protein